MTIDHDELEREIRRALEAEAERIEVPEDLAELTLSVAREEEPSLLERLRARLDVRRAEGARRTGLPKLAYGAAAAVLFFGFAFLGQLVTGEGGLERLAQSPVESTDPETATADQPVSLPTPGIEPEPTPNGPTVQNDDTAERSGAGSEDASGSNQAQGQLGPSDFEGDASATIAQEGQANSGESVAGSQGSGVVSEGGSTSVTGSAAGTAQEDDNEVSSPPEEDLPALAQGSGSLSPELIREAEIDVRVEEGRFQEARRRAEDIAEAHGGIVTSFATEEEPGDEIARGTLLLRIPAERLQDAIGAYRDLGDLARLETSGTDVSGRLTDLDARIRNARAEEERLLELLDEAEDVDDTLDIRRRIDDAREEIEELEGQKQDLQNEVDFSTVQLTIFEPGQEEGDENPAPDGRLETAFGRGADIAATVLSGLLVAVLALAPLAALGALVWGAVRLRRRRSAE